MTDNEYYNYLTKAAKYFFDLNLSKVVDDLIVYLFHLFEYIISYIRRLIYSYDFVRFIDSKETTAHKIDYTLFDNCVYYFKRGLNYFPNMKHYCLFAPMIFEIWIMMTSNSITGLWILGSYSITLSCLWSIVWSREDVSSTICRIIGWKYEDFDLTEFIRVFSFASILIGLIKFIWAIYTMDFLMIILSISVSNRIYRNIRSYLEIESVCEKH